MVQFILASLLIFSFNSHAQFLGFGGSDSAAKSKVPDLLEKLKSLEMKLEPLYEESFNLTVKNIENTIEEEKLFCSGEAVDAAGKLLPPDKKQLCMRELKKQYLEYMDLVFDLKKKYLEMIYSRQTEGLSKVHKDLKANIEKNF